MKGKSEIRLTTPAHVAELAATMRPQDAAEVWATGHHTPEQAILESIRVSEFSHTLLLGGAVGAIFGVAHGSVIWVLTGSAVEEHKKEFLRASKGILRDLCHHYPLLQNVVDARYSRALRWAEWIGFTVATAEPFGVEGRLFHHVYIRR